MSLTIVKPLTVTPAMLVGTDVAETDYPEWVLGTTYGLGERVIVAADHKVYESADVSNTGNSPSGSSKWAEVGPTNRWRAFDLSNSTQTAQSGSMYFEVRPGQSVNSVALLNFTSVSTIQITVTSVVFGLVYDVEYLATSPLDSPSWYSWFFRDRVERSQIIDLGIPSYPDATIRIEFAGSTDMAVGVVMLGNQRVIGKYVQQGANIGIQDYSRKESSEYGDTILVERAFAKRATFPVFLASSEIDSVQTYIAGIRATPCLWMGGGNLEATTIYGFYKDFDITINYADYADCSLEIEGLT